MLENSSQGPVSLYLIKIPFESQLSVLKTVCEEAAEGQTWGETMGESHSTNRNFHFSSGKLSVRRGGWTSPISPPDSVGKWGSCRYHSTLGQTRNHSPVCTPPVLQGVGDLEQETVTQKLTSLSHTPAHRMGEGKAPGHGGILPAQVCAKPHTPMTTAQGRACYILKSLKHIIFLRISLLCTYNARKPGLFCSQNSFQCKSKWAAKYNSINVGIFF